MREDWIECTVDDVIELMKNGSSSKQFNEKVGYPITRIETIWNEAIDLQRVKYIKENDQELIEKHGLRFGDILLSHINSDSHLGKTAIFKNQTKILIHGINLLLLRPYEQLNQDFINYQFKFLRAKGKFVDEAQRAVNQSSINQRKLKRFPIKLAPLPEQRAIVAKIEQLFSELDNCIANLKAAKDKLEIYRAAVLQYAFENSFSEEIELEEVVEDHMIGIVRALKDQNTDGYGTPYIKMNNVNLNGQIDLKDVVWVEVDSKELEKYRLKNNDILINTRNSFELVGKTGIVSGLKTDYVFNNNLLRLRIKEDYLPKFIAYQLISPMVRNQMRQGKKATTNVCALYQRNIFPLKIRITDFDTQNQIVQEIETRLSVCDNILANIEEGLEKSEALRQSILKQAFEGKLLSEEELEACRAAPDWEPAEKLLERIKNEKLAKA